MCPPGLMCKLYCPWLNPYLFVSLGKWLATSREQLVLADLWRYCWEPGGTHSTVGFPQECAPVVCRGFAPIFELDLIIRASDLVNRLRLLCVLGGDAVSSLCVPLCLFDEALSQTALSDLGILVVAGVHFNVSGQVLYPGGDSVRAGLRVLVSVVTGDGDRLPMTMAAHPLTGGSGCCGWLQFVMRERGLWLLQSARERAL